MDYTPPPIRDTDEQTTVLTREQADEVVQALAQASGWLHGGIEAEERELALKCHEACRSVLMSTLAIRSALGQRIGIVSAVGESA